ncbi:MAG: gfo/Idh/MocA family oxidoreductase [Candidatus Hydrogenedens sp.]|nr:gfo/Idh/MocA family oxidoreductase [Candidatus Hydrogenedens sp.]
MSRNHITRRAFLAATTTATVAAATGCATKTNTAKVVPGKRSPNELINIAAIGAGGKGFTDIMQCYKSGMVNVVALADVDWKRAEECFYNLRETSAVHYKDYREMLDKHPEIDACTISTPDHTHAPAAYLAMNLGKHVYVQKPLTHTIAEARLLMETAAKNGVVTQMGNQGHCGNGVRDLCEMIWDGAIGQVTEAHIWTNRPVWPQGKDFPAPLPGQPVPDTMDWDLWIGAAPMRPYNEGYAPFSWRGWWDFGCGAIGDMACHIMDPAFWSLKLYEAETFEVETIFQEGMTDQSPPNKSIIKFKVPARGDMAAVDVYWHDGGMLPERPAGIPADQQLGDGDNGSLYIGTDGFATAGEYGGDARLMPDERMASYTRPDQTIPRIPEESPYLDWLTAIREGHKSVSDFSYAALLTEMANFGNVALLAGKPLAWDRNAFKITNDEAANALLTKEYRKGWELPC